MIGKASFSEEKLMENYQTFMDALMKGRPAAAKGIFINKITISSSMGPGIKVQQ